LAILNADKKGTIIDEEKILIIQGIINTSLKMMEKTMTEKSAKKRAKRRSGSHNQSKTDMAHNNILFDLLIGKQHLPARPRDFRLNLADKEKNIGRAELSDILSSIVKISMLENKRNNYPYPRGRPKLYLSDELRGRKDSYYESSKIKVIIDEILNDPEAIKAIDNALIGSDIFYNYLKYSFETALYQMKENEQAFLNSFKPMIRKYGLSYKKKDELDESWIYVKDLTEDKLKALAGAYSRNMIAQFKKDGKNIFYTIAGLLYFGDAYKS
jgi:hypothetical protein